MAAFPVIERGFYREADGPVTDPVAETACETDSA
jgi:hypothetical protein